MGRYKELLLNTGLFAISSISVKFISFVLVPLYTFYLSASEYGITDMSVVVVSLMTPLCTFSITDAVLRFAIDDKNNSTRYMLIGLQITVLSIVVAGALLPLLDFSFFGGLGRYKVLFLINYAVSVFQLYFGTVARIQNQIKLIPISSIISALSNVACSYYFIVFLRMKIYGYFYAMIISGIICVLVYVVKGQYLTLILAKPSSSDVALLKKMVSFALPLVPNSIFWWIGTSINRFLITSLLGIAASGLFAAASKIPNLITTVYQIFQQAWNLSVFQEFRHSGLARFYEIVFKFVLAGLSLSASLLILIAKPIATVVLQKGFFSSWILMPLLIVAVFFNSLNSFLGTISTAAMKTKNLFVTTCVGALLNVLITGLLIPTCGLYGACLGMCVSNFVILCMRFAISLKIIYFKIPWIRLSVLIMILCLQSFLVISNGNPVYWLQVCLFVAMAVLSIGLVFPEVTRFMQKKKASKVLK